MRVGVCGFGGLAMIGVMAFAIACHGYHHSWWQRWHNSVNTEALHLFVCVLWFVCVGVCGFGGLAMIGVMAFAIACHGYHHSWWQR